MYCITVIKSFTFYMCKKDAYAIIIVAQIYFNTYVHTDYTDT